MTATDSSSTGWAKAIAVGVLCALIPVLVLSANHGWLRWPIAITGLLLILTAVCVISFAPAASPAGGREDGEGDDGPSVHTQAPR